MSPRTIQARRVVAKHQASAESKSVLSLVKTGIPLALVGVMLLGVVLLGVLAPRGDEDEGDVQVAAVSATWDCTGTPCPWGVRQTNEAAVWPAAAEPTRARLGYTVSDDVYGAAAKVAGWKVTVVTGKATVWAGTPNGSHQSLATLAAGQSFTVPARGAGELVSVQSDEPFRYALTPPCIDPTHCDPVSWVRSVWRYNGAGPNPGDWGGGVITWPSWSAFASNNRTGFDSRTVYSKSGGQKLYPYMGEWADGCEVEVVTGGVLIVEWERGRSPWRETFLSAGETHTIDLVGSENGAMIETPNNVEPFEVSLSNCTPQKIDKGASE